MRFEFFIAAKFLRSKNKDRIISVSNILTFIGISLGVSALILVMSVMNGYEKEFLDRMLSMKGHINIVNNFHLIKDYEKVSNLIMENKKISKELKNVIPILEKQVLVISEKSVYGCIMIGMDYNFIQTKGIRLINSIDEVSKKYELGENNIILGSKLSEYLGVDLGDSIRIVIPQYSYLDNAISTESVEHKVIGVFDSGMNEYNSVIMFGSLKLAQKLFKQSDSVNYLEVNLNSYSKTDYVKSEIDDVMRSYSTKNLDNDFSKYNVLDWKTLNNNIVSALHIEKVTMSMILIIIILIASFNMISSLTLLVRDKMSSIAILRSMGCTSRSTMYIFMICGAFIGVMGTIMGGILGIIASKNVFYIQKFLEFAFGIKFLDPAVYQLTSLPSVILWHQVALSMMLSFILSIVSTIYPAFRVSKIPPAVMLRKIQ